MGGGASTVAAYSMFGLDHGAEKEKQRLLKAMRLKGKKGRIFRDMTGFGKRSKITKQKRKRAQSRYGKKRRRFKK